MSDLRLDTGKETKADLVTERKRLARAWFEDLRDRICAALEALEDRLEGTGYPDMAPGRFERTAWKRPGEKGEDAGGGVMSVMRGRLFEKAGVNVSTVYGTFSPEFAKQIPGADKNPTFWASGVSLVIHPRSPHVPTVHMNTRHIVTTKAWFGGGADLTPMLDEQRRDDAKDARDFHAAMKKACDAHGSDYYEKYKKWCDEYFYLPHRKEPRGIGGIFYDYKEEDFDKDFAFTRDVGEAFLGIYPEIVARHMDKPWNETEKAEQLRRRGRYVEFNLIHDRGTKFGLQTGGNTEAILMSLPPEATWA